MNSWWLNPQALDRIAEVAARLDAEFPGERFYALGASPAAVSIALEQIRFSAGGHGGGVLRLPFSGSVCDHMGRDERGGARREIYRLAVDGAALDTSLSAYARVLEENGFHIAQICAAHAQAGQVSNIMDSRQVDGDGMASFAYAANRLAARQGLAREFARAVRYVDISARSGLGTHMAISDRETDLDVPVQRVAISQTDQQDIMDSCDDQLSPRLVPHYYINPRQGQLNSDQWRDGLRAAFEERTGERHDAVISLIVGNLMAAVDRRSPCPRG